MVFNTPEVFICSPCSVQCVTVCTPLWCSLWPSLCAPVVFIVVQFVRPCGVHCGPVCAPLWCSLCPSLYAPVVFIVAQFVRPCSVHCAPVCAPLSHDSVATSDLAYVTKLLPAPAPGQNYWKRHEIQLARSAGRAGCFATPFDQPHVSDPAATPHLDTPWSLSGHCALSLPPASPLHGFQGIGTD